MNFDRIVFLDFDGVIVTRRTRYRTLDPICMIPLQRIIRETQAKIVISSTWRIGRTLEELRTLMGEVGASVVDVTPIDHYSFDRPRGEEIQQWLDANPTGSFIILDDEVDMAGLESRLVRTHVETGLTEEDADRAIRMFLNT